MHRAIAAIICIMSAYSTAYAGASFDVLIQSAGEPPTFASSGLQPMPFLIGTDRIPAADGPATNISAAYSGRHLSPYATLQLDVHRAQQVIRRYLMENLGCDKVKLCMTNYTKPKEGFFSTTWGGFTLNLTASCSAGFKDFRFDMSPAADYEDYTDVLIGYMRNSVWIEKDIVARPKGDDFRRASSIQYVADCDFSPVDPALPYSIITDPWHLRTFPK